MGAVWFVGMLWGLLKQCLGFGKKKQQPSVLDADGYSNADAVKDARHHTHAPKQQSFGG